MEEELFGFQIVSGLHGVLGQAICGVQVNGRKAMNRYMIVIPAKNRSFLLKCDEGDGAKLETLQKLVSGYVETVPSALDATWAREEADRLVLLVDEEGRLKCKAANQKATQLAPADVTANGIFISLPLTSRAGWENKIFS